MGTMNAVENVPVGAVVAVATWAAPKSTATVSLAPNPPPFIVTLVVGGPKPGFRVMLVVTAATGAANRPRARTVPAAATVSSRDRTHQRKSPAITRASSTGTARILTERVASWGVRTGLPPPLGFGSGHFQVLPFQRKITVLVLVLVLVLAEPTAQASLADVAVTPERAASAPGLGLGTRVHAVPFHRTITVLPPVAPPLAPTAQALRAETAATL